MTMLRANAVVLSVVLSATCTSAFSVGKSALKTPFVSRSVLAMAEDEKKDFFMQEPSKGEPEGAKTTFVSSVFKKELAFDEKSGRFFETGFGEGDCVPEDEFCITDKETGDTVRLTIEEKERIFLDALQSYYSSGRKLLGDSDFDLLKEDLEWNGSPMVLMNQKEVKYMTAMQEFLKGSPIMQDQEFDALKKELKEDGSKFAVDAEPKCYIDTGICKATFEPDKFRSNLLYLPVGVILMTVWLFLGYELIEPFIRINPVFLAAIGVPLISPLNKGITENFIFKDKFILYGPCPSCSASNRVYFGNILGVEGFTDVAQCKCANCKTNFNVQRFSYRASTVPK